MILADSHAHLDFPDFADDFSATLRRALGAGVGYINLVATSLEAVPLLLAHCDTAPELRVVAGVHPHAANGYAGGMDDLIQAASHPKVVAIGETGLDFFYDHGDRDRQEALFRWHVQAARRLRLPLVIHTREAEAMTRQVLDEEGAAAVGGVLHCFTGSPELAWWAIEQGFHLSFSGILTFRNAEPLRQLAAQLPLDRLLVETDSPYLAPIPYRGQRNEPAHVVKVAEALAAARGLSLLEVANATTANYRRLFLAHSVDAAAAPLAAPTLAYAIGDALYLNLSRGCTNRCDFCPKWSRPLVHQYDLTLPRPPSVAELIAAMGELTPYREVVFCGFGEPTLRLEALLAVAAEVKRQGKRVRVNTDGLANLVHRQDITPRLAGLVDALSVSLNAQDEATYNRHCQPALSGAYASLLAFIRAAKPHVPEITATVVEGLPGVEVEACRRLAAELGVGFRVRQLGRVG